MDASEWVRSIQQSRELWGATLASTVLALGYRAGSAFARFALEPSLILSGGAVIGIAAGSWSLPIAAAIAVGLVLAMRQSPSVAATPWVVVSSWMACWSVYIGVPETKRSLAIGGATIIAGATCLLTAQSWGRSATVLSASLASVALIDSAGRDSPIYGGLGVVVIHVALSRTIARPWALAIAWLGMLGSARVGGLRDSSLEALGISLACAALALAAVGVDRTLIDRRVERRRLARPETSQG